MPCSNPTAEAQRPAVPLSGKLLYHLMPVRRGVVMSNLHRVFGATMPESEIVALAQAFYGHLFRSAIEYLRYTNLSVAKRSALVRVENKTVVLRAFERGKGVLFLAGHLGNWEIGCISGIMNFPELKDRLHVVRRPLVPRVLDRIVARRFRNAGLGVIPKYDAMQTILSLLAANRAVGFVMDQHAASREGVRVQFLGAAAWTFRSLAAVARRSGAPVLPVATWREPDGSHVLRFEDPLDFIECDDLAETIRVNTQRYNNALERMILRHPEQRLWMHRRWKHAD